MEQIKQRQEGIIEEFSMLEDNMEMTLDYIMELGAELGSFPEELRTEENIVEGCQSKVWVAGRLENGNVSLRADSNTAITKGLVSLLVRVMNQMPPEDVMNAEIYFPKQIGMDRFIGTQRSNGFASMIDHIKLAAARVMTEKEGQ